MMVESLMMPPILVSLTGPSRHQICTVVPVFFGLRAPSWPSWHRIGGRPVVVVFLMHMMRRLNVLLGWACRLTMTPVRLGLLEQWQHTTLIFFLFSFHSILPSLTLVSHTGWLGCIRHIDHCASMLFVSFPQMVPMLLHDPNGWFCLTSKS